ncbi:MAG: PqqD family protein [Alphaproteobacteria bacterium]|nr:PqqD family protein [Alphaproteobacteria bacterium]
MTVQRDGEGAILLDLRTNAYFELNGTGLSIWEALAAGRSPAAIAEGLVEAFDVGADEARGAVDALLAELADAGLLEGSEARGGRLRRLIRRMRG